MCREANDLFTPVEQGGALITSETKPIAIDQGNGLSGPQPLPPGYSWASLPQAIKDKVTKNMHLPDGVTPVGFAAWAMSDTQHNMVHWFNHMDDATYTADQQQASPDAKQP